MAPTADFDPSVPPGTDLLRNGAARIRSVTEGITILFGGNGVDPLSLGAPFSFFDATAQAVGRLSVIDPVNPDEIANKKLVDGKLIVSATLTSADQITYTGTTTPDITGAYNPNALYLLTNVGPTNIGAVNLQLGTGGPFVMLKHVDGSDLQGGDLIAGQLALVAYVPSPSNTFRLINFFGGSLAADPTAALGAATKQYVDQTVNPPTTRAPMTVSTIALTTTGADIIVPPAITVPAGNPYLLFVEFMVYVQIVMPQETESDTAIWVTDGASFWAFAGNAFRNGTNGNGGAAVMLGGAGYAPTPYTGGATVNLKLQGAHYGPGTTGTAQQTKFGTYGPATLPQSYVAATLVRTHS